MKIKRFEDNRNGYHKFTRFVNEEILRLRNTLQPYHLDLGPNFKSLDRGTAQNSLAVYRMFKKFEQPQAENASERAEKSIREMFAYDEAGLTYFNPGLSQANISRTDFSARSDAFSTIGRSNFLNIR